MAYKHTENFGALFDTEEKKSEFYPDMQGDLCLPGGKIMRIAAWRKTSSNGKSFLSLKLSEQKETPTAAMAEVRNETPINSDLGF